jgi:acid stress chaperone HdeB
MLALGASVPAWTQVMLDLSKVTCWQYVTYKVANPKYLAVWVSGYYNGKNGNTVIDMQELLANAAKLEEYCTKNPDVPMMAAAEKVLGQKN